mgnify:CR=1 FL=1
MKTKFIFPIIFLLVSSLSFSQDHREKREKVKALKVAYITEQLELTSDEAEKFWPIYNTFEDKQSELRHEKMRAILDRFQPGNVDKLSEKEASALLIQMEKIEELTLYAIEQNKAIEKQNKEIEELKAQVKALLAK